MKFKALTDYSMILKIVTFISGISLIAATLLSFFNGNWGWAILLADKLSGPIGKVLQVIAPFLLHLFKSSLSLIWLPIAIYLGVAFLTPSRWWRFFLCLISLCVMLWFIRLTSLDHFSLSMSTKLFVYLIDAYLLLLWTLPKEVWNFVGGILWFIQSLIFTILPDLPGNFDDFGMVSAIFIFIFLYIHTLASLIQRFADSFVVKFAAYVKKLISKDLAAEK